MTATGLKPQLVTGSGTFVPSGRPAGAYGRDDLLPNGAKIRGTNILRPDGLAGASSYPYFASQWVLIDDVLPWFESCMDAAASIGCNVVTLTGSAHAAGSGHMTRQAYLDAWTAAIEAAETRGLYIYARAQSYYVDDFELLSLATLLDELVPWAEHVHGLRRVVGIDLVQEGQPWASISAGTDGRTLYNAVREVTDIPCTYSIIGSSGSPMNGAERATLAFVDHYDFHWYFNPASTAIESGYWSAGETKPVVIGEFGMPVSDGQAAQEARYSSVVAAVNATGATSARRSAGGIQWACADYDDPANTSNLYGMFTGALTARSWLTSRVDDIAVV